MRVSLVLAVSSCVVLVLTACGGAAYGAEEAPSKAAAVAETCPFDSLAVTALNQLPSCKPHEQLPIAILGYSYIDPIGAYYDGWTPYAGPPFLPDCPLDDVS